MAEMSSNGHKKSKRMSGDGELTFDERRAARKLNLSDRTLRRYRKQSLIPFYRVGSRILYDDSCLLEFLNKQRQSARAA